MKSTQSRFKLALRRGGAFPSLHRLVVSALAMAVLPSAGRAGIVIDGEFEDWEGGGSGSPQPVVVEDPADLPDTSGDIRRVEAVVDGDELVLTLAVEGIVTPPVEQTPEGKSNRYYYHWLLDTDNDAATGFSNSEYEGNQTNLEKPIGGDVVVQIGWKDGAPNGVEVYDPLDEQGGPLLEDFPFSSDGAVLTARVPLEVLGLQAGQTIGFSAYQEGASDGWMVDWVESATLTIAAGSGGPQPVVVEDPADLPDTSGDIRRVEAVVDGDDLVLTLAVEGIVTPSVEQTPAGKSNRYYYHWLLDTDNDAATGFSNSEYEGNQTNLEKPIGGDVVVQIGWKDGAPNGVEVYDPLDEQGGPLLEDFSFSSDGAVLTARVPLEVLGLQAGQTIAFSGYQEGASDGWMVDWVESATLTIPAGDSSGVISVEDPADLGDSSGDLALIQMTVDAEFLYLRMSVHGIIAPTVEQTPEGKTNRYYYHWILDTDNDPATGFPNSEYEGTPTGVERPVGAELVVQIGWRNGAADGVYAYDPTDEGGGALVEDFEYQASGDSLEAKLPLAALGLQIGQTVGFSAFQEGASDDWAVDWMESAAAALVIPSSGNIDLVVDAVADPYSAMAVMEDDARGEVDTGTVVLLVDGMALEGAASKEGGQTVISGLMPAPLAPETEHTLRVEYQLVGSPGVHGRSVPFSTPAYSVVPPGYAVGEVDENAPGFALYLTQISEAQSGVESLHGNRGELAETQFAGQMRSADGRLYYNEGSDSTTQWSVSERTAAGIINWYEEAPTEVGNFRQSTGYADQPIPGIPGAKNSTNGIVMEIVAYLELERGFHRLAVNTTGGYKIQMGPAVRDRLGRLIDQFDGSRRYSYEADHYFNVLIDEPGFYPVRLLWYHSKRTNQGGQLEFYSIKDRRRIPINDVSDPESLRSFRSSPATVPYFSGVSPAPGDTGIDPFAPLRFEITDGTANTVAGSERLLVDGVEVIPEVTRENGKSVLSYQPYTFDLGTTHTVGVSYDIAGDPPGSRSETYQFGVHSDALELPPIWASPAGEGGPRGFALRSVQSEAERANTVAAAETQLASNGDFEGSAETGTVNFSLSPGGDGGIFAGDTGLADAGLMAPENSEFASMETVAYLQLDAGLHTLGINSDDGFLLTAGRTGAEQTLELGRFEGGRGDSASPQNLFDVVVRQPGLYAFRLMWYQGNGDASVEWYAYDRSTGTATLLNDASAPGAIPVYRTRTADPAIPAGPAIAVAAEMTLPQLFTDTVSYPFAVWVHNAGTAPLAIESAVLSGGAAGSFVLEEAPLAIAAGGSGAVHLRFQPGGVTGRHETTLILDSNDPGEAAGGSRVRIVGGVVDPVGPWAHYRLDDAAGSADLADSSGYGRSADLVTGSGSATLGVEALAAGTALEIAGGGAVRVAGNKFEAWRDVSLAFWVRAENPADTQTLFAMGADPTDPAFALVLAGGQLLWFADGEAQFGTPGAPITAGGTHHVVLTYRESEEGSAASLWVDGAAEASAEAGEIPPLPGNRASTLFFGAFFDVLPLAGVVDDLQIYGRWLTAEEIATLRENPGDALGGGEPPVPGAPPVITVVGFGVDGAFLVGFPTAVGSRYVLEYSPDLTTGSWIDVPGVLQGTGQLGYLRDFDVDRLAVPQGYYRVRVQ